MTPTTPEPPFTQREREWLAEAIWNVLLDTRQTWMDRKIALAFERADAHDVERAADRRTPPTAPKLCTFTRDGFACGLSADEHKGYDHPYQCDGDERTPPTGCADGAGGERCARPDLEELAERLMLKLEHYFGMRATSRNTAKATVYATLLDAVDSASPAPSAYPTTVCGDHWESSGRPLSCIKPHGHDGMHTSDGISWGDERATAALERLRRLIDDRRTCNLPDELRDDFRAVLDALDATRAELAEANARVTEYIKRHAEMVMELAEARRELDRQRVTKDDTDALASMLADGRAANTLTKVLNERTDAAEYDRAVLKRALAERTAERDAALEELRLLCVAVQTCRHAHHACDPLTEAVNRAALAATGKGDGE